MKLNIQDVSVPLVWAEDGQVIRVQGTRVPLATLVNEYNNGSAPEEIVMDFDTLSLPHVYAVISYYLQNQSTVDEYLAQEQVQKETIRRETQAKHEQQQFRERLMARMAKIERA